jgi:hypothetical protein
MGVATLAALPAAKYAGVADRLQALAKEAA